MAQLDFVSLILIALSLSLDCFAVAVSASVAMPKVPYLRALRTSFAFGFAQFLMPVLGWLAGRTIVDIIAGFDHWIAFVLLAAVGVRMLWESFHSRESSTRAADITRGWLLLTLAVATSIDALAVGLSFAFVKINIVSASATIGVVALIVSVLGFTLGRRVGGVLGRQAKLAGGVILIGIGLRILLSHLL